MKFLLYLSDFIVPFVIFYIVGFGILMKTNVYEHFIKGARKGFFTVIKIMPTLIGLMVAVGVLRASGFLDFFAEVVSRFVVHIGFPVQLVPLTIVRMFSSSAATGLVLDIFKEYGNKFKFPPETFKHAVWVNVYNDDCFTDIDGHLAMDNGKPVTLWTWLGNIAVSKQS